MMEVMNNLFLRGQIRLSKFSEKLVREEKGASDMVTIMVIIVIVIGVAAVFSKQLTSAVTSVFSKLTNFIEAGAPTE